MSMNFIGMTTEEIKDELWMHEQMCRNTIIEDEFLIDMDEAESAEYDECQEDLF